MDDELNRQYRRWRISEAEDRDEDADAAFLGVVRTALPSEPAPLQFTAKTMQAVAEAADRDRRRAARVRRTLVPVGVVSCLVVVYLSAGLLIRAVSTVFVWAIDLLVGLVVTGATTLPAGGDVWSVLSGIGHATAALLANPTVTITVIAIQGVALAAFAALQRLLRSDGESLR